jgi:molybdopterin-guanine dinucleotide biosynthesis protein MobB
VFRFGIDRLAGDPALLSGSRVALLSHPAGVTREIEPSWKALRRAGVDLVRLFGPEHGIDGSEQDMAAVADGIHAESGLPARSLYGDSRESLALAPEDLSGVDALVCDLQDVGARYYTFVWTALMAIDACARAGVRAVVCDRPNPLGRAVEGEPQRDGFLSFVGAEAVPVRHGRTIGELARRHCRSRGLDVDLQVVRMQGWAGSVGWPADAPWVAPSPNMPSRETVRVYPGACLVEATNLSEARGTTAPFRQIGAPWLDAARLADAMSEMALPGIEFRPVHFRPAFQKHAGVVCHGIFLHVTEPAVFRPYETGLRLLESARAQAPDRFAWREEPYEFDRRPAIDLLTGSEEFRRGIDAGADLSEYYARQFRVESGDEETSLYPDQRPFLLGVSGPHDSGKTTVIEKLIPLLRERGLGVGAVKHTPHEVEGDVIGKDSWRLRRAGADPTAFVRPGATAVHAGARELDDLLRLEFGECDIVLVEGYRSLPLRRVEIGRSRPRSVELGERDFTDDLGGLVAEICRLGRLP